jgi:glyoxylase I family protein
MTIDVFGVTPLLEVFDMPTSIRFYRDVLSFEIVDSYGTGDQMTWAMLKLGPSRVMLNTAYDEGERPESPDPGRIKGHADTELFFECTDVDKVYFHLREQGCDVNEPGVTYYGMRQVWLEDPDGFRICFQARLKP